MFSAPAFRASLSAVLLVYPCYGALAEENEDIRIRVGLGGQVRPDYLGSDGTEWAPLWDLAVARGSNQFEFEAPDDSFDIKLYSKDGFSFGPAASIAGGRKRSDVGERVDKLSTTIEVGAFAQYYVSDSIRLRAETRKGIGGHEGVVASLGADHVWRKGDDYVFSIGAPPAAVRCPLPARLVRGGRQFGNQLGPAAIPAGRRHPRRRGNRRRYLSAESTLGTVRFRAIRAPGR